MLDNENAEMWTVQMTCNAEFGNGIKSEQTDVQVVGKWKCAVKIGIRSDRISGGSWVGIHK